MAKDSEHILFIGTFTRDTASEGIYTARFDTVSGELSLTGALYAADNPTYLALAPSRGILYAVNEVNDVAGKASGAITAFAIDPGDGALRTLNQKPTGGPGPCYLSLDATGRFVLATNFFDPARSGGSICVLPTAPDGQLEEVSDFHLLEGTGRIPMEQEKPRVHSIISDPSNRFVLGANVGTDRIHVYRLQPEHGKLERHDPWAQLATGSGPRHTCFSPDGRWLFAVNEQDSSATLCSWDQAAGKLTPVQHISTLPEGFDETNHCADIHVAPSGRYLYCSNRGHDSIAIFSFDPIKGELQAKGHVHTGGKAPRGFTLDPTGRFLLAGNHFSDCINVFALDPDSGLPVYTGCSVQVPAPVCLKFL